MSEQSGFGWESTDSDINKYFRQVGSADGTVKGEERVSPIPYRFITLDRQSNKSRWTKSVDRTVYRFYNNIQTVTSDKGWTDFVTDGITIRKQLMLNLWNDLGNLPGDRIPWYLRSMPVPGFGPLSYAYGYLRNGRPDKYLIGPDGQPLWHPAHGAKPIKMYWVAAHVTRYIEPENGGALEKMEGPAILLLKEWQARELASTIDLMREMKGVDWQIDGFPFHIINMTLGRPQDVALKVTPAGSHSPEDREVYNMADRLDARPDFMAQGNALYKAMEDLLVSENCPIKDFPHIGDHAKDGWTASKPLATVQWEASKGEPEEAKETKKARFADRSVGELREIAAEYGIVLAKNAKREQIIEAIETVEVPF
jgi:hypothetical protein